MEKLQIVVKAKDTLATKLADPDPETLEKVRRLAAKIPTLAGLASPQIQRLAAAAAEAERRALEDEAVREMLARYGLTVDSHRMSIMTALQAECIASTERTRELFEFMLEDES